MNAPTAPDATRLPLSEARIADGAFDQMRIANLARWPSGADVDFDHEGRFLLTVAVTSADESEVYHWIDRRFELSVFAKTGGVGLVRFDGRWSVSEEPSGARTRITVDG